MAHPDLPKKFGHKPSGSLKRFYEPVIEAAVEYNVSLLKLIQQAGAKTVMNSILIGISSEMMLEANIPLSINSMLANLRVGMNFEQAARLAADIGFSKTEDLIKKKNGGSFHSII